MRLLATRHFAIDLDRARRLIRATRSGVPFESIEEIDLEVARLGAALDRMHGEWRLLVDLRAVPLRNDPAFEMAIQRLRRRLLAGAARAALLVRTAVGALQVTRHVREDHGDAEVFDDEARALAYLTAPASAEQQPVQRR
jgi:hypothetical protein